MLAAAQSQYSRLVACTLILFDVIDFHFFKVIAYIFRRQHYRLLLMITAIQVIAEKVSKHAEYIIDAIKCNSHLCRQSTLRRYWRDWTLVIVYLRHLALQELSMNL